MVSTNLFPLTKHIGSVLCVFNTHRRVINDDLLEEAFSVSKSRTKKDLIHEALREFVLIKKRKDLTELAGTIQFHKGFDHKQLRKIKR
ncbi:MAG: type II toxin-antitoxin system VapB family antitoxin [Deltaproteobacteria bacterium]|nr:type II toxin-antitoxin system VapB family antitoxin [Deltaproteobacteria bacterium]